MLAAVLLLPTVPVPVPVVVVLIVGAGVTRSSSVPPPKMIPWNVLLVLLVPRESDRVTVTVQSIFTE